MRPEMRSALTSPVSPCMYSFIGRRGDEADHLVTPAVGLHERRVLLQVFEQPILKRRQPKEPARLRTAHQRPFVIRALSGVLGMDFVAFELLAAWAKPAFVFPLINVAVVVDFLNELSAALLVAFAAGRTPHGPERDAIDRERGASNLGAMVNVGVRRQAAICSSVAGTTSISVTMAPSMCSVSRRPEAARASAWSFRRC